MVKVSVILPSLNVKNYIRQCIESVIGQTERDIEIICVDAGSTDGTLEILREYEAQDNRVKLLVSDKKSYGYQMNLGVDAASGEYIGIVETDDYILPEMYEQLYKIAKEQELDFVKSDFYRFTGEGDALKKVYNRLSKSSNDYNCLFDIKRWQDAFIFPMNTWCGIYRREFLSENRIRHNETPGASYQDNGFWFQTFIFSKRVWFTDHAYYMNRRDNPESSVFNADKVYCICDEYDFIYGILNANKKLMEDYGKAFSVACFHAYKGSYDRISDIYKKDFLIRWSEDLRKLSDKGLLDQDRFSEAEWRMIKDIMKDPVCFYNCNVDAKARFYEIIDEYRDIIIYGAGMIGRRILNDLMNREDPKRILCFAVSKKEDNQDDYKGIPVKEIGDVLEYRNNALVIIGTTIVYQDEIRCTLEGLGFRNIIAYPDLQTAIL